MVFITRNSAVRLALDLDDFVLEIEIVNRQSENFARSQQKRRFKDVEIKCTHFAPSGTEIDSNTRTIYQVFEAHSTQEIRQMNMGLIHSQVGRSGCQIVNLTVLFGEAAKSSV